MAAAVGESRSDGRGGSAKKDAIVAAARADPFQSVAEIARQVGTTPGYVRTTLSGVGLSLTRLRAQRARRWSRLASREPPRESLAPAELPTVDSLLGCSLPVFSSRQGTYLGAIRPVRLLARIGGEGGGGECVAVGRWDEEGAKGAYLFLIGRSLQLEGLSSRPVWKQTLVVPVSLPEELSSGERPWGGVGLYVEQVPAREEPSGLLARITLLPVRTGVLFRTEGKAGTCEVVRYLVVE